MHPSNDDRGRRGALLLLYDIDGTILQVQRGLSMINFTAAFSKAHRLDNVVMENGYTFHGRTDKSIHRDVCGFNQIGPDRADEVESHFISLLVDGWHRLLNRETVSLLPGAREVIMQTSADARFFNSLLTGNVRAGAEAKLNTHDLYGSFIGGGFGSDALERDRLPSFALQRVLEEGGESFAPEQTVIIGDSLRDIQCARANNLHVVAVATGGDSLATLSQAQPDLLVASLTETDRLFSFFESINS